LLAAVPFAGRAAPLVTLTVDMRDVYPATHWAVTGHPPAYDTPDEDVYLDGRNIVLLSKTSVLCARLGINRIALGPLSNNPFPDASPEFFSTIGRALSLGLAKEISIDTPLTSRHKEDVIQLGVELGVPLELSMSCMSPVGAPDYVHCGACSKCRERRDAFAAAGVPDPTKYAVEWKRV
jgi:7-cyano-7-deazaguanine synthase